MTALTGPLGCPTTTLISKKGSTFCSKKMGKIAIEIMDFIKENGTFAAGSDV
jgi:hypothetical protein